MNFGFFMIYSRKNCIMCGIYVEWLIFLSLILTIIGLPVEFMIYYPITSLKLHEATDCVISYKGMPSPTPSQAPSRWNADDVFLETFVVTATLVESGKSFQGIACLSTEAHVGSGILGNEMPYPYIYSSSTPALWQCSYCPSSLECFQMMPTNGTVRSSCKLAYANDMGISLMNPSWLDGTAQFDDTYIPMSEYVTFIVFCVGINGLSILIILSFLCACSCESCVHCCKNAYFDLMIEKNQRLKNSYPLPPLPPSASCPLLPDRPSAAVPYYGNN